MKLGNPRADNLHRAIQAEKTNFVTPMIRKCIGPRCRRIRSIAQFAGDSEYCKTCAQDLPK